MAKKAPSKRSRAARRATSPSIDTDKSLKNVKAPETSTDFRPSILGIHQSAGVAKKTRKQGRKAVLTAKARRRADKGADRAEQIMDRTEKKLQRSKDSSRLIQARARAWDDINTDAMTAAEAAEAIEATKQQKKKDAKGGKKAEDAEQEAVDKFFADTDEEMDEVEDPSGKAENPAARNGIIRGAVADLPLDQTQPLPDSDDDL